MFLSAVVLFSCSPESWFVWPSCFLQNGFSFSVSVLIERGVLGPENYIFHGCPAALSRHLISLAVLHFCKSIFLFEQLYLPGMVLWVKKDFADPAFHTPGFFGCLVF